MAMRERGGRGTNPSRPPRLIVGRVYEQFKPMSEWRQEDDYDTLLVYLPGFQKEYIKVTTEDLNIVRVRGERLVAENKWSRFQEDFRVPENCEMRGIRARFDGGILTITMPRKIINGPPHTTNTTTRVPPKTEDQPSRRPQPKEEALPKPKEEPKKKKPNTPQSRPLDDKTLPPPTTNTTTRVPPKTEDQPSRRPQQEEALPKPKEEALPKPKEEALPKPNTPQSRPLDVKTLPPQLKPMPTSSNTPTKQLPIKQATEAKKVNDDITFGSLPTSVPKKDKNNVVESPNVAKKKDLDEEKRIEALLEEIAKRDIERKKGQLNDAHAGFRGAEIKNVLEKRGEVNEDRKVLMNVGVAVLVIVALGVHVSYTIGLIGKGK